VAESLLAGFPVVIEWPVAWGDMDAYQHVNNTVYFRYFEHVRLEYLQRLRWLEYQQATGVGVILAAIEARFRRPLTYPDTLQLAARIPDLGEDRFTVEHRIVSRRLGEVAAEGKGTMVAFDYRQQKKVPIPQEMRQRIAELEGRTTPP
jgi:acyl-CoA thioester hydrolase